jgi:mono/diheme cytochrome c family protein
MVTLDRCRKIFICAVIAVSFVAGLPPVATLASDEDTELIAYGERLVHNMDCNVCHTPKVFTPAGPQRDTSRLLSGHSADETLPTIPKGQIGPQGWGGFFNNGLTAWAGPWGVSFGSNLTPDHKTGIGSWTEEIFIQVMRTGLRLGNARPFLPPMPTYSRLTDEELHAIYAYLRSLKPIQNAVPKALPPTQPDQ